MATQDLEKLIVKLDADLRSYERALAKAQGLTTTQMRKIERDVQASATRVESQFNRMGKAALAFGKGFLAGIGIESVRRAGMAIKGLVDQAARLGDMSDRIGLTTDQLQAMAIGAAEADLSMEELNKAFLRFSKGIGEAASGTGDLLEVLQANGRELKSNFFDNLKQFADLVANAGSEQEKWLLITQAFGERAEGMLEFLSKGSRGLEQMQMQLQATGTALDENLIREMQRINDEWAVLWHQMETSVQKFALTSVRNWSQAIKDMSNVRPDERSALGILMDWWSGRSTPSEALRPFGGVPRTSTGGGFLDPQAPPTIIPGGASEKIAKVAKAAREAKEPMDLLASSASNLGTEISHTNEALDVSKSALSGLLQDLAAGVAPIDALTSAITRLADQLIEMATSGLLDALFAGLAGSAAGGGSAPAGGMGLFASALYHDGGKVGSGGRRRLVSASAFAGAKRMHSGGLAGDEVPAILQRGEMVLPKGARGAGGGSVTNIYTQPGMRAERRESREGSMRREDVYIFMDDYMGSNHGQRTMGAMYGLRPQIKRR